MLRCLLLAGLVATIVTAQADVPFKEELVRIGSAGVTHMNIRGFLVPRMEPVDNIPTFVFRTSPDNEIESMEGLLGFRCMPLDGIYATDEVPSKATLLCSGVAFQKKMIFLFGTEGFNFTPNEKAVNLMLEDKVVMNLKSVPETLLGSTILGDRVGKQFGGGFSGSGAQAGSVSFGGGGGLGGFPGGGFGGGFSGSQASAGAGSFGGGGGFFG